jgi:hypothetical protein
MTKPTLADRLDALVKQLGATPSNYVFQPTGDGRESLRIVVDPATGEFRAGVGATKADAIADLERKLGSK